MTISPNLSLRFSNEDKAALKEVAERLQMNQTQTIRVLVREVLVVLKDREPQKKTGASMESGNKKSAILREQDSKTNQQRTGTQQ